MVDTDELIGSAEAERILGVNRATISRWVKDNKLNTAMKLPGLRGPMLFRRSDVERLAARLHPGEHTP
jgi:predicted site-specific integrase-resolvase